MSVTFVLSVTKYLARNNLEKGGDTLHYLYNLFKVLSTRAGYREARTWSQKAG